MAKDAAPAGWGEFLGKELTVVESTDPGLVGLQGEVLDETMRTFVVRAASGKVVRVPKAVATFRISDGRPVRIEGHRIQYRPEDRIKKVRS
ncbi:MAG: ribonuclease P protein subunit [Euryarchaeota archaeon]|nr:ribonuclease P protein subunit [Euryarchaeota archaeon]